MKPAKFEAAKIKKLHLALKHGTATAMEDWLKCAGGWESELKRSIEELLLECPCKVAKDPLPHSIVSQSIPEQRKHTAASLDIVFLEGVPVMHAVGKCIEWSETSILKNRTLVEQVSTFCKIWVYRHGLPTKTPADREYFKGSSAKFCRDHDIELVELAANDHEANGTVERANRTLRIFFRRLRSEQQKTVLSKTLSEATYAKNIYKGSKMASSFQLLYGQPPRIMTDQDIFKIPAVKMAERVQDVAKKRLGKLVESKQRRQPEVSIGDYVYFWRDKLRWKGPARVV